MKYERRALVACDNCDAADYQIFFSEDAGMPEACPFCGEELEDVRVYEKEEFEELEDFIREFDVEDDD
jgi:hypothetical protein